MSLQRKRSGRRRASCRAARVLGQETAQLGAKVSESSKVAVKTRRHMGVRAGTTREASQMPPAQLRAKTTQPMNGGKCPQQRRSEALRTRVQPPPEVCMSQYAGNGGIATASTGRVTFKLYTPVPETPLGAETHEGSKVACDAPVKEQFYRNFRIFCACNGGMWNSKKSSEPNGSQHPQARATNV